MANNDIYNKLSQHFIGFNTDAILRNRDNYPVYDILQYVEDDYLHYRVDVAVAGFKSEDLDVSVKQNTLVISANEHKPVDENITYIKRSIAKRKFDLMFKIEKNVVVQRVLLKDGILSVILMEEKPKEQITKKIPIIVE